jgi:hypothetical protein
MAPAVHAAEHKPWQLAEAAAAGLRVPRTAITNDPDAAAGFATDAAPVLYKAFRAEPVRIGGKTHLVYATPVDAEQCRSEAVRVAPVMLQTRIDKAFDARVTCVTDMSSPSLRAAWVVSSRWIGGSITTRTSGSLSLCPTRCAPGCWTCWTAWACDSLPVTSPLVIQGCGGAAAIADALTRHPTPP